MPKPRAFDQVCINMEMLWQPILLLKFGDIFSICKFKEQDTRLVDSKNKTRTNLDLKNRETTEM